MQNFSTIRLIVRGASQKNLRGGGINPPPARARVNFNLCNCGATIQMSPFAQAALLKW